LNVNNKDDISTGITSSRAANAKPQASLNGSLSHREYGMTKPESKGLSEAVMATDSDT
jgi:hypothetical protein